MLKGMTRYAALLAAFVAQCIGAARADVRVLVTAEKIKWSNSATAIYLNGSSVVGTNVIDEAAVYDNLVLVYTSISADNWLVIDESIKAGARILVVGGGGAGGNATGTAANYGAGGGGGAGGFIEKTRTLNGGSYSVTVGAGGAASQNAGVAGGDGTESSFDDLVAYGGGGGGSGCDGSAGASGGGGSQQFVNRVVTTHIGGAGTSEQGNAGGDGLYGFSAGGGGGAGAAGGNSRASNSGGIGGDGLASDISGEMLYYAGGGGGGTRNRSSDSADLGKGGLGGGGNGGGSGTPTPGVNGLGGGGGGGSAQNVGGAVGGDGVVIVRITQAVETQVKVPETDELTYTYNGENQVALNFGIAYTLVDDPDNVTNATNVGTYTFLVKPGPELEWVGGGTETKTVTWKIVTRQIDKPTMAENLVFEPGTSQIGATFTDDCLQYCTFADGGKTNAVNAGDYSFTLSLKDKSNTAWADGTTDDFVGNWSIAPQKVAKPVPAANLVYNREEQRAFASLDLAHYELTAGVTNATEGGEYQFTFALLGNGDSTNYVWDADPATAEPYSGTWTISAAANAITKFAIKNWQLGKTPKEPELSAKYGVETAKITYGFGTSKTDVTEWLDNPNDIDTKGAWIARVVIEATDSWDAAEGIAPFEIWSDPSEYFAYWTEIKIKGGATEVQNVQIPVKISPARMQGFFYEHEGKSGKGLVFVDANGNALPYEVDTWDTAGESLVWLRVATLPPEGTLVKMYWHHRDGTSNPFEYSPTEVWDGYVGVWHMNEESGNVADATGHGLTAVPNGAKKAEMVAAEGVFGNARINATSVTPAQSKGTHAGYLLIPSYDSFGLGGEFTYSGWYKASATNGYPRFVSRKNNHTDDNGWEIEMNNNSLTVATARGSTNTPQVTSIPLPNITNDWMLLTLVYSNATLSVYANGALAKSGAIKPATDNNRKLAIGSDSDGNEWAFVGKYDECRLCGGAASADLVKIQYDAATDDGFVVTNDFVYHDGRKVNAWVERPEMDYTRWDASGTPGAFTSTGDLAYGSVSNVIYSVYDPTKTFASPADITEAGIYRAVFLPVYESPEEAAQWEDISYEIDIHVTKSKPYSDIGGGNSGRVLLMNNHTYARDNPSNIDYQGWYDADNAGANSSATTTYWHHENLDTPAVTSFNLQNGTESKLYRADGSRLWHIVSCRHGNTYPTSPDDNLSSIQNYLSWDRTYSRTINDHSLNRRTGLQTPANRSTVGQLVMQNTTNAVVYSSCFTNGIGTIYFDAVNGWTRSGEDYENYKIIVEYATNTVAGLEPSDINSQKITIEEVGSDEGDYAVLVTTTNLYGNLEGQWHRAEMIPFLKDNTAEFVRLDSTNELTLAVAHGGTMDNFYRVAVKLDITGPIRFRIRRTSSDEDRQVDASSFILLDNIIASLPAMRGDLVSAGRYDSTKNGTQVLGWELATSVPYPSASDAGLVLKAIPEYFVNTDGDVDTTTFFADAMVYYRWRYLNQVVNEWKTMDLNPADGFKTVGPLELPGRACDVEYWFKYTLQAPFYQYVDYSGVNKAIDYTEERGTLTNALNSATLLASAGTNWYFRVREGVSDYSGVDLVCIREGSTEVERVPMSLVSDHMWHGFLRTAENQKGELKFRFEALDRQTEPFAEYAASTNYWSSRTAKVQFKNSVSIEEMTEGDWMTITNDAVTGHVMFQLDDSDTSKMLTVVHADYQNFNGWSDANDREGRDLNGNPLRPVFVGTSSTNEYKKVGVSPAKQTFAEDFDDWKTMPATNAWWQVSSYPDISHLYGNAVPYESFSGASDQLWSIGPGMYVSKEYKHDANGSGVAVQMEDGAGFLQFFDRDAAPRGIETISFNARLGQFVRFSDFAVYYGDNSLNMSNYTFVTRATFDLKKNAGFKGNASLSLVANHVWNKGCYEARWEYIGTKFAKNLSNNKGQRLCLYRWNKTSSEPTLLGAWTNTAFNIPSVNGSLLRTSTLMPFFISVSNSVDSTWIIAGVRHTSLANSSAIPSDETQNWGGVAYRDNSPSRLKVGTYGVLSANCDGVFARPEISMDSVIMPNADVNPAGGQQKQYTWQKMPVGKLENTTNCGSRDGFGGEDVPWNLNVGRMKSALDDTSVYSIKSDVAPKALEVYLGTAGRADFGSTPYWSTNFTSFGSGNKISVPIYSPTDCSVKIAVGKALSEERTDIVLDSVELRQWRGGDWDNDNEVNGASMYLPDWAKAPGRTQEYAHSNFVFTSCWVTNNTVLMSAKRTDKSKVSAIRSPLMDGMPRTGRGGDGTVRGLGFGSISIEYKNAQPSAILELQIATNDVTASNIRNYDNGFDQWTTVETYDFKDLPSNGILNHYFGLHSVTGAIRLVVSTNAIANVADKSNPAEFGDVTIASIVCSDEPPVDIHSWWGWNMRTIGGDYDSEEKMLLSDFATAAGWSGLSLALNNSVSTNYDISMIDLSDSESYCAHRPFVQTPTFVSNVVGEVSFKARKYSTDSATPVLVLLGSTDASDTNEGTWKELGGAVFNVTNSFYETYSYKTDPGKDYKAFRLVIAGFIADVNEKYGPDVATPAERVLVDDLCVSEAVRACMGFRNVGCFKSDITGTSEVMNVPSRLEQPLCEEAWGVQCEIYGKELADEIDFERTPTVRLHWFDRGRETVTGGRSPWGFENWRDLSESEGHKSATLVRATGTAEDRFVYRSSQRACPDAVIGMSLSAPTYVQYMLEVIYYTKGATVATTNYMTRAEWGEDGRGPEWYRPVDLNDDPAYGRGLERNFAAYNILDNVAPGWAWINEVNIIGLYQSAENSDADMQYVEIAQTPESNIEGWSLRYLEAQTGNDMVVTNTLATFGLNGLSGKKDATWIDPEANMVFRVIGNQQAYRNGRLKYSDGTLDGIMRVDNNNVTYMSVADNGDVEISATRPFGLQLVRKSGIVEHEIVVMGTNRWSNLPAIYVSAYHPTNTVNFLNKKIPGAQFFYLGVDDDGGEPNSLGVWDGFGATSNEWNNTMVKTPGAKNQNQTIPLDHPVPNGENVLVYFMVSGGHVTQWDGEAFTNATVLATVTKGSLSGTNITYRVEPWYELGELTTNGVALPGPYPVTKATLPREYTVAVGKGVSNNVTVVAKAVPDQSLADYGIVESNPYSEAVIDWLNKGTDIFGRPFADIESGEIRLADVLDLGGHVVTNMTLTEMYWLDMDPTAGHLALIGGMESIVPETHSMIGPDGSQLENVRVKVHLMITNRSETASAPAEKCFDNDFGTHWTPYVLRGLEPGSSSIDYDPRRDDWNSVTFKVTGLLLNRREFGWQNRMPLRWFVFQPNSFDANGVSSIEIVDPHSPLSVGYNSGWGEWWEQHGTDADDGIGWLWSIDTRLQPVTIEVLKTENYYGE